jgi:hypothetical protein
MLKETKNSWLLFLPLFIFISLLLRESPVLKNVNSSDNSTESIRKNTFFSIEEKLSQLYVIKNDSLIIDTATEKVLSIISGDVNGYLDDYFLEKTYPSLQGKKLLELLSCYRLYKQEEKRINELYLSLKADQLVDYRALQYKFFGKLAQDLFFDHHTFYTNAEASGIKLVSPVVTAVVPIACSRIHNVE